MLAEKPLDSNGCEIPWMNYNIVNFLKERFKKNMLLFEYGSGFSTKFYSKYVLKVTSVEHDKKWYEVISTDKPKNCKIIYSKYDNQMMGGDYSKMILNQNEIFNVIVVDGRDRVNCIKNSINALDKDGIVILDDSSREKYKPAFEFMQSNGFKQITFSGLKSSGRKDDFTTIFYKEDNCFEI